MAALAKVSNGRSLLPPAFTRCAVTSGIRGAFLDCIFSQINLSTRANSGARISANLSWGLWLSSLSNVAPIALLDSCSVDPYYYHMEELLRTNDITVIAYANAVLTESGIDVFELDVNTSVLEGSIGILPRRLMVRSDDLIRAQQLMRYHEIAFR